jgi:competence protein ComEC
MSKFFLLWLFLISLVVIRIFTIPKSTFKSGDHIRIISTINQEPARYDNSQYLKINKLKIYLDPYPQINYGDKIMIEGIVKGDRLTLVKLINIIKPINPLYLIRLKIIDFYKKTLPSPDDALVSGIVLGSKQNLSEKFQETLKSSGTMHVVVASGMNVVFIAGFLINTLILYINRRKAVIFAIIGIWIYAVIAGFEAPIVRAAIMGSIAFSSQALGRVYQSVRILFVTALIMIIFSPSWIYDLGFILSFAATLSLMMFNTLIYSKLYFVPKLIREDLSTSLSAQIGVFPILYITFGQLNFFSPFINALVLWTIAPITIIGGVAGVLSLASQTLAKYILFLCYPLTQFFIKTITLFT